MENERIEELREKFKREREEDEMHEYDHEDQEQCVLCGNWEDIIVNEVCDDCLEKNTTLRNAIKFGEENKVNVEINGFIANVYSADEINRILKRNLEEDKTQTFEIKQVLKEAENYCLKDKYDFSEFLKKENE